MQLIEIKVVVWCKYRDLLTRQKPKAKYALFYEESKIADPVKFLRILARVTGQTRRATPESGFSDTS